MMTRWFIFDPSISWLRSLVTWVVSQGTKQICWGFDDVKQLMFQTPNKPIGGLAFYECLPHVRLVFYMLSFSKGCFFLNVYIYIYIAFWCKQMNYRQSSQRCWSPTDDHVWNSYIHIRLYMYHRNGLQILELRMSGCLISYVLWLTLYEHCCQMYSHVSRQYITVNLQYQAVCIQHSYGFDVFVISFV